MSLQGNIILREWNENPLRFILFLAIITRLVAVIFSKGFGWFDDHFLIIEASQSWVDGHDYNRWLPSSEGNTGPTGHNLFYTGLHFLIFKFFAWLNLSDPQSKMYVIRLLHASLSLLVVFFGYKITLRLGDKRSARIVGLLLAVFWLFPFISVRNLVEFTCIPFLFWGTWILIKDNNPRNPIINGLIAGLILGLAFCMRFQSLSYVGGIGIALLLIGRWKEAFASGFGFLVTAFLCLGTIDIFIWGYPFAELGEYIRYNMYNYDEYLPGPWYQYLLVILGILIPPMSIYLFYGLFYEFYKNWKKSLIIFLPVIIFLIFHSYYPNKQERFILPILPFIIILGTIGWQRFLGVSQFWKKNKRLLKSSMIFFWTLNTVMLLVLTTTYSKRSRVESMYYLSRYKNIEIILVENTNQYNVNLMPNYYLGQWVLQGEVSKSKSIQDLPGRFLSARENHPDFIILEGEKNIDERVRSLQKAFPDMVYETCISPGLIDRILFWLNPINENQNAYIYRNATLHPILSEEVK